MTPNEKLIKFMKTKADFIVQNTYIPISSNKYFNEQDKIEIAGWTEQEASWIWIHILETITKLNGSADWLTGTGLDMDFCPFCLHSNFRCKTCSYATRHGGQCSDNEASDFALITEELDEAEAGFTKGIYTNIINKITTRGWSNDTK